MKGDLLLVSPFPFDVFLGSIVYRVGGSAECMNKALVKVAESHEFLYSFVARGCFPISYDRCLDAVNFNSFIVDDES